MSLTLSTLPNIYPVYNDDLELTATESTADANFVYNFTISLNGTVIDSFNYFADPISFDATINLNHILAPHFESSVYTNTTNIMEIIPSSVYYYTVTVKSYSGSTLIDTEVTSTKYVYNGCYDKQDQFDIDDYIFQTAKLSNFLTRWNNNRILTLNDKAYLTTISGNYTTYVSNFGGIEVTAYNSNFTVVSHTFAYTGNVNKGLLSIDISPSRLNQDYTGFITSNTLYYTVKEINNKTNTVMRIDLITNKKHSDYYNFIYLNKFGGIDFITSTSLSTTSIDVEKEILDQYTIQKVYNTVIEEEVNTLTEYISYEQNNAVQDLFSSSAVKVYFNSLLSDVRITTDKHLLRKRYPKNDLIRLDINFIYNNKKYIQQY